MTSAAAANLTEATALLTRQAKSLVGVLLLTNEVEGAVREALSALQTTGTAYLGGLTVRLSARAQDAAQSRSIRSMSDRAFERFAYGM